MKKQTMFDFYKNAINETLDTNETFAFWLENQRFFDGGSKQHPSKNNLSRLEPQVKKGDTLQHDSLIECGAVSVTSPAEEFSPAEQLYYDTFGEVF